jgi:hypothetical protein
MTAHGSGRGVARLWFSFGHELMKCIIEREGKREIIGTKLVFGFAAAGTLAGR